MPEGRESYSDPVEVFEPIVECRWVAVQLHPFAVKHKRTREIFEELRRRLGDDLQICYAVAEDEYNKYKSPFDEYLFVEYRDGISYSNLRDEDFFIGALLTASGQPQIICNNELDSVREVQFALPNYTPGDTVLIAEGAYHGYRGRILELEPSDIKGEAQAIVKVLLGESDCIAALPYRWLKKVKKIK